VRWDVYRYAICVDDELECTRLWESNVQVWEMSSGELVGAAIYERNGVGYLLTHPNHRSVDAAMLDWLETRHRAHKPAGVHRWPFTVYIQDDDPASVYLLTRKNYIRQGAAMINRRRWLSDEIPSLALPPGYNLRQLNPDRLADLQRLCDTDQAVFGGRQWTPATIRVISRSVAYRPDLDLVVEAPDLSFAAFTTAWYDAANHAGEFDPVGTHPLHRDKRLAQAIMTEGLRRLQALGARVAYAGAEANSPAQRLYHSLGFNESEVEGEWELLT
jgi:GNAT superfamily N-acetyltransferase